MGQHQVEAEAEEDGFGNKGSEEGGEGLKVEGSKQPCRP